MKRGGAAAGRRRERGRGRKGQGRREMRGGERAKDITF